MVYFMILIYAGNISAGITKKMQTLGLVKPSRFRVGFKIFT